jgi:hypothetical protein
VAVRTQHLAKPGRRAIVVTDLANLRGPAQGTVGLPLGYLGAALIAASRRRHFVACGATSWTPRIAIRRPISLPVRPGYSVDAMTRQTVSTTPGGHIGYRVLAMRSPSHKKQSGDRIGG